MSIGLVQALSESGGGPANRVWLKSSAYAGRLLLGDNGNPWASAAQYLAFFSQAHGLLRPDVAVVEVGELFASWLKANPSALVELTTKRRPTFALRKLLEFDAPRDVLAEVIAAVVTHLRGQAPLVLSLPSPRRWIAEANALAGQRYEDLDPETAEDAAMYIADLLRAVSDQPVAGVLFEESPTSPALDPTEVERYRPLVNVVRHYRWALAIRSSEIASADDIDVADVDILIGERAGSRRSGTDGTDISRRLWGSEGVPMLNGATFYFAEIPVDAKPELVLEAIERLRASAP